MVWMTKYSGGRLISEPLIELHYYEGLGIEGRSVRAFPVVL